MLENFFKDFSLCSTNIPKRISPRKNVLRTILRTPRGGGGYFHNCDKQHISYTKTRTKGEGVVKICIIRMAYLMDAPRRFFIKFPPKIHRYMNYYWNFTNFPFMNAFQAFFLKLIQLFLRNLFKNFTYLLSSTSLVLSFKICFSFYKELHEMVFLKCIF